MTLVHHVCKEAEGLESLFLISKSNCAFANFRDEEASVAAQRKLHDSKFLTVRLVSRLRKSTVEGPAGVTAPTGPAAATVGGQTDSTTEPTSAVGDGGDGEGRTAGPDTVSSRPRSESSSGGVPVDGATAQKDRFFILKSLTVEDIELSVKTNIWATQSHNEQMLNKAFKASTRTNHASLPVPGRRLTLVVGTELRQCLSHLFSEQVGRVFRLCANGLSDQR